MMARFAFGCGAASKKWGQSLASVLEAANSAGAAPNRVRVWRLDDLQGLAEQMRRAVGLGVSTFDITLPVPGRADWRPWRVGTEYGWGHGLIFRLLRQQYQAAFGAAVGLMHIYTWQRVGAVLEGEGQG